MTLRGMQGWIRHEGRLVQVYCQQGGGTQGGTLVGSERDEEWGQAEQVATLLRVTCVVHR